MERENNPFKIAQKNKRLIHQAELLKEKIQYTEDCEELISSKSISKLKSIERSLSKNKNLIKEEEDKKSLIHLLVKTTLNGNSTDTIQEEKEPKKKHKKSKLAWKNIYYGIDRKKYNYF